MPRIYSTEQNIFYLRAFREQNERLIARFYGEHCAEFKRNIRNEFGTKLNGYAEDIFQDSIIQLRAHIVSGKVNEDNLTVPLGGYLYGIGRKIAQWYERRLGIDKGSNVDLTEISEDLHYVDADDSEGLTEDDIQLIHHYVNRMGEPCNTVLSLFYFERRSMEYIAQVLDYKNTDTAKTRKNKCMIKLKSAIKSHLYGIFNI